MMELVHLRFNTVRSDGADLNSDGFPDGRINPDRVHSKDGSLFLEQKFNGSYFIGADL